MCASFLSTSFPHEFFLSTSYDLNRPQPGERGAVVFFFPPSFLSSYGSLGSDSPSFPPFTPPWNAQKRDYHFIFIIALTKINFFFFSPFSFANLKNPVGDMSGDDESRGTKSMICYVFSSLPFSSYFCMSSYRVDFWPA